MSIQRTTNFSVKVSAGSRVRLSGKSPRATVSWFLHLNTGTILEDGCGISLK